MKEYFDYLINKLDLDDIKNPKSYSPLVLAYIGDAFYDVIIRTMIIAKGNKQVRKMHNEAKNYVKASAQATIFYNIEKLLTEEELNVFKRGRNAKSGSIPKNADVLDYRCATGFESLVGYLYLKKDFERIIDLISEGISK